MVETIWIMSILTLR